MQDERRAGESSETDVSVLPFRPLTLRAPVADSADGDRFTAVLTEFSLPARVTVEKNPDGSGIAHGTILVSEGERPLQAQTVGGMLRWSELSSTTLKIALATALDGVVYLDDVEYRLGGDEEASSRAGHAGEPRVRSTGGGATTTTDTGTDANANAAEDADAAEGLAGGDGRAPASGLLQNFVFHSGDAGEFGGMLARSAGQPLHMLRDGRSAVFAPTGSGDDVFESGVWAAAGSVAMWKQSGGRVAGIGVTRDLLLHVWDQDWRRLDPAPHVRDDDGLAVVDYLDRLDDPDLDANDWTDALGLDAERAQELRILFRRDASDERTFARLAEILRVPTVLAEIAEGHTTLAEQPGATVVEPMSTWKAFRQAVREETSGSAGSSSSGSSGSGSTRSGSTSGSASAHDSVDAPHAPQAPAGWAGHRHRRSGLYLTLLAVVFAGLSAVLVAKIVTGNLDTAWIQWLLLIVLVADVSWPRGRGRQHPTDRA